MHVCAIYIFNLADNLIKLGLFALELSLTCQVESFARVKVVKGISLFIISHRSSQQRPAFPLKPFKPETKLPAEFAFMNRLKSISTDLCPFL